MHSTQGHYLLRIKQQLTNTHTVSQGGSASYFLPAKPALPYVIQRVPPILDQNEPCETACVGNDIGDNGPTAKTRRDKRWQALQSSIRAKAMTKK